jgi:hypothetical protein
MGNNNYFMHVACDKNALCDTYIVEFIHDDTENYYWRGKYSCRSFHGTKTPLYMVVLLSYVCYY